MIKYIIVDDEEIAHDIIKGYCDVLPDLKLMTNCYDAIEAMEYLRQHSVDLIFLDLNMPKLKGFDFLRTLASPPKVIVTTAYKEYALEGYELNISDYLLKPFSFERFLKAVNKAMSTTETIKNSPNVSPDNRNETIFLKEEHRYTQVSLRDILYLESSGNYTKVITTENTLKIREKVSNLLSTFSEGDFIQVHKSFAVAKEHIDSIEGNRIFMGEHVVPIGKLYKLRVNELVKPSGK